MKGKGFDRLRGVAAAGAMGVGLLGGASVARGAPTTTPVSVMVSSGTWTAWWSSIQNSSAVIITDPNTTTYTSTTMFNISDASLDTAGTSFTDLFDYAFQLIVDGVGFVEPDGIVGT